MCRKENNQHGAGLGGCAACCSPYKDRYMMTAQGVVIAAFCLSWVWWLVLLIATPPLIMLQAVWCCSMRKRGILAAMVFCVLSAVLMVCAGIYIILAWRDNTWCYVFILHPVYDDDYVLDGEDDDDDNDYCAEIAWAVIAFVDAGLFAGAAYCLCIFAFRRMDKLMAQIKDEQVVDAQHVAVEMGTINAAPVTVAEPGKPAVAAMVSAPSFHMEKEAHLM